MSPCRLKRASSHQGCQLGQITCSGGDCRGKVLYDPAANEGNELSQVQERENVAAMITIQGIGATTSADMEELKEAVSVRLAHRQGARLHFGSIDYGMILQSAFHHTGGAMLDAGTAWRSGIGLYVPLHPPLGPDLAANAYAAMQVSIAQQLHAAYVDGGSETPVAFVAHGDCSEVFSNYLADAQRFREGDAASVGIWADPRRFADQIAGTQSLSDEEIDFLGGRSVRYFLTTGYSAPILDVARTVGTAFEPAIAPNTGFEWHNFYDDDHLVGWPRAALSGVAGTRIRDHRVHIAQKTQGGGVQVGSLWRLDEFLGHLCGPDGDLWKPVGIRSAGSRKTDDVIGSGRDLLEPPAMEHDRVQLLARIKVLFGASDSSRASNGPAPSFLVLPEGGVPSFDIDLAPYEGEVTPPDEAMAHWLDTPNQRFGGGRPREFLEGNEDERALLSEVLDSIEDGAFT